MCKLNFDVASEPSSTKMSTIRLSTVHSGLVVILTFVIGSILIEEASTVERKSNI